MRHLSTCLFCGLFLLTSWLSSGAAQAQDGRWQSDYRGGYGPVPVYDRGRSVAGLHARDRAAPRQRRRTAVEPLPPYQSLARPYVIDAEGNRCTGFGRLFPLQRAGIRPQASPDRSLRALGRTMIERRSQEADPQGDSEMPAGYTFFGQFVDHDITFDTTSMLNMPIRDDRLRNARTAELDLDSVYGGGPEETPYLYHLPYLRVGRTVHGDGLVRRDLLRVAGSEAPGPAGGAARALIGDPRNDENFILAQMHGAFIALHNRIVDRLVERRHGQARHRYCGRDASCDTRRLAAALPRASRNRIYEAARDHVTHYYHRVIVEDFLPRLIGQARVRDLRSGGRDLFFPRGFAGGRGTVAKPFIPVEFAVAAFRFGHSQVRETYWLRDGVRKSLFSRDGVRGGRAGSPAFKPLRADLVVDWRYFFDIGPRPRHGFNLARKIDTEIARSLHDLGAFNVVGRREVVSLPARNLSRGRTLRLPSGQVVADRILPALQARGALAFWGGHPGAGRGERSAAWQAFRLRPDHRTRELLGETDTPLWYYVLQEAAAFGTRAGARSLHLSRSGPGTGRRYAALGASRGFAVRHERVAYRGASGAGGLGHTLGPVGGTIVGEVLLGLVDHYRAKTGKGLGYRPEVHAALLTPHRSGATRAPYTMGDLLLGAGSARPATRAAPAATRPYEPRYEPRYAPRDCYERDGTPCGREPAPRRDDYAPEVEVVGPAVPAVPFVVPVPRYRPYRRVRSTDETFATNDP